MPRHVTLYHIPPSPQFIAFLNRRILRHLESGLGGNSLELIDTSDYRDLADYIMLPDPNEEPEFAPRRVNDRAMP